MERIRTSGGWPKLKAEGSSTKHVVPFALELARKFLTPSKVLVAEMMVRFYAILDSQGMFLDQDAALELKQLGVSLCNLYSTIARNHADAGEKMWKPSLKIAFILTSL